MVCIHQVNFYASTPANATSSTVLTYGSVPSSPSSAFINFHGAHRTSVQAGTSHKGFLVELRCNNSAAASSGSSNPDPRTRHDFTRMQGTAIDVAAAATTAAAAAATTVTTVSEQTIGSSAGWLIGLGQSGPTFATTTSSQESRCAAFFQGQGIHNRTVQCNASLGNYNNIISLYSDEIIFPLTWPQQQSSISFGPPVSPPVLPVRPHHYIHPQLQHVDSAALGSSAMRSGSLALERQNIIVSPGTAIQPIPPALLVNAQRSAECIRESRARNDSWTATCMCSPCGDFAVVGIPAARPTLF